MTCEGMTLFSITDSENREFSVLAIEKETQGYKKIRINQDSIVEIINDDGRSHAFGRSRIDFIAKAYARVSK